MSFNMPLQKTRGPISLATKEWRDRFDRQLFGDRYVDWRNDAQLAALAGATVHPLPDAGQQQQVGEHPPRSPTCGECV